jgi:hypothetical protein
MREKSKRRIKVLFVFAFSILAAVTFLTPESGKAAEPGKTMPVQMVLDDVDKKMTENAGDYGKVPFDHDQHVAKDSCVTCHHTNSKKLTVAMEEEVSKCAVCHAKDDSKVNEIEGTNEDKKFKGVEAMNSKDAFHGDGSIAGCIGCHKERDIKPVSCKVCHTGEEKVNYQYKK